MVDVVGPFRLQVAERIVRQGRGEMHDGVEALQVAGLMSRRSLRIARRRVAVLAQGTISSEIEESKPTTSYPAACRNGIMIEPIYSDCGPVTRTRIGLFDIPHFPRRTLCRIARAPPAGADVPQGVHALPKRVPSSNREAQLDELCAPALWLDALVDGHLSNGAASGGLPIRHTNNVYPTWAAGLGFAQPLPFGTHQPHGRSRRASLAADLFGVVAGDEIGSDAVIFNDLQCRSTGGRGFFLMPRSVRNCFKPRSRPDPNRNLNPANVRSHAQSRPLADSCNR